MFPAPPPLPFEEFKRRYEKLAAEGKPTTIENIDPEFDAWRRRSTIPDWMWAAVILAAVVVFALMGYAALHR